MHIIFWAVPDFILVEPVIGSGPVIASTGYSTKSASLLPADVVIQPVIAPISLAYSIPPITYGVLPLAAIPTTISLLDKFIFFKSSIANSFESSAPSTAFTSASFPPAINPMTILLSTP